jgi:hypothetical protein
MRRRGRFSAISIAAVAVLGAPATAPAASVSLRGKAIQVRDFGGEENAISIARAGGALVVSDGRRPLTAEGGCRRQGDAVRCPLPSKVRVLVRAGRGDDTVVVEDAIAGIQLFGDAGNDALAVSGGAALLSGGAGDDTLRSGSAAVRADGGDGDDELLGGSRTVEFDGGAGSDTLDFTASSEPVVVAVQGGARRTLSRSAATRIEELRTTAYEDAVTAGEGPLTVDTGLGDDTLTAIAEVKATLGFGNDEAQGGAFNDRIDGGPGTDTIRGGDGDDVLSGNDDNDTLEGQAGADVLSGDEGTDKLLATADRVLAEDGERDEVACTGPTAVNADDALDELTGDCQPTDAQIFAPPAAAAGPSAPPPTVKSHLHRSGRTRYVLVRVGARPGASATVAITPIVNGRRRAPLVVTVRANRWTMATGARLRGAQRVTTRIRKLS